MKIELETEFKPGDVVWRKNLVTNEARQVTITRVDVYYFLKEGLMQTMPLPRRRQRTPVRDTNQIIKEE